MKHIHTFEDFLNEKILNEDQRFLNFRYGAGMDKIQIDTIENYKKAQKVDAEFEKAAKHFGNLPGVFVLTAQKPKDVETINLLAKKHSVFGIWAADNDDNEIFITRAN